MKNLADLNCVELKSFVDSFDDVLLDCDGVIWNHGVVFPQIEKTILKLNEFGKQVRFVSNNSAYGSLGLYKNLSKLQCDIQYNDVAIPLLAIIDYLKKIKYDQEIFVLGSSAFKSELSSAGFNIIHTDSLRTIELSAKHFNQNTQDNKNIGAVVFDVDLNLNYIQLSKARVYLDRPEVLYITGASDKLFENGLNLPAMGMRYFHDILKDVTGKNSISMSKPSVNFSNYLKEAFKIKDPSRTLFVGDSLETDMKFATECGYQKLLVLTGLTKIEEVNECPDEYFYIDSLGNLGDLLIN